VACDDRACNCSGRRKQGATAIHALSEHEGKAALAEFDVPPRGKLVSATAAAERRALGF
jgi:hypothetical protein